MAYAQINLNPISIHALLAESDWWLRCWQLAARDISIHALLAESDLHESSLYRDHNSNFYPRSPCGERRCFRCCAISCITISIHALLAESDARRASRQQPAGISIHALLAESDPAELTTLVNKLFISIHALLAESDEPQNEIIAYDNDFYPRSPCGERQVRAQL